MFLRLLDPVQPTSPSFPLPSGRFLFDPDLNIINSLTSEPPLLFKLLPEWVVDDMADFLLFGLQFLPQVITDLLMFPSQSKFFTNCVSGGVQLLLPLLDHLAADHALPHSLLCKSLSRLKTC